MKKKFLRFAALLLTILMFLPLAEPVVAFADNDDNQTQNGDKKDNDNKKDKDDKDKGKTAGDDESKWAAVTDAYMKTVYSSVEARIYAEGPDVTESMERNGKIRSMFFVTMTDDGYALYIDKSTGELICLKLARDKSGNFYRHPSYADDKQKIYDLNGNKSACIWDYTGYWSTNPYSIGAIKASENVKKELYSQLKIEYTENEEDFEYYSFEKSAQLDQIKVKNIRNGVRVEYTVGEEAVRYLVPRFLTDERYKQMLEKVRAGLKDAYKDDPGELDDKLKRFEARYIAVTKEKLSSTSPNYMKEAVENYGVCWQYNPSFSQGKKLTEIEEYIKKYTNYDFSWLDDVHAETSYVTSDKKPAVFKLAIEYTVDKNGLVVRCAAGNIRFDVGRFKLSNVYLLPYAGAGNTNNKGYALYPDGSGTIVDFTNVPKDKEFITTTTAYGQDYSYSTVSGANKEVARLPVFGMVEKENRLDGGDSTHGYLAYVEEGESLANITLKSSGSKHIYLQAYTSFNPRPKDTYSLSGGISTGADAMWTVESKRRYTKNYKLRIFILEKDNSSYSAMANMLRKYLIDNGTLPSDEDFAERIGKGHKDIPLIIETLGAIKSSKRVLGIPVSTMKALTSFEDIQTSIIDTLKNKDINNIVIKLNGWLDGGLKFNVPSGVDVESAVGGSKGFKKLIKYCKENKVQLYPDFDFTYSRKDSWFDGFNSNDDLAHTIDDRKAYKKEYSPVFQAYSRYSYGVISADKMMHFYDKTYEDYKDYGLGSISASSLGSYLNSDFNPDNPLTREDSKVLINKLLTKMSSENESIMLSGGNVYTLKYADYITDVPLEDSKFRYATASIPFFSMILHGAVEYSGTALNLAGDYQSAILKTIESGAVPYYIVALQNTSDLKNTLDMTENYTKYYSVRYSIWLRDIYDTYKLLNEALKDVRCSVISSHEFIDDDYMVAKVVYSNGCSFVVNYRDSAYTYYDGGRLHTVGARNFLKFDASGNLVKIN